MATAAPYCTVAGNRAIARFVKQAKDWAHLDIFAWAPEARAGRPFGGTDQGIRAVYGYLRQRYS